MSVERGQTLSHYRLVEKIGEGGMGVVWKAEDTVLNRLVAIKVLPADVSRDDKRRELFLEEARLASSVSDAHIVQVHEFGRQGDLDYIVMEYIEGKPLNKLLHGRPLPPEKVAALGLQIARALSRAHRKGLIHRDLKPSNILITSDGDVKVVDFGLAALFEDGGSSFGSGHTTRTGTASFHTGSRRSPRLVGTLPYMSPEQVRGRKLDARSDIFSLGSVLYEMTTGQRPFRGSNTKELMQEITRSRPKLPHELVSRLPFELNRIIEKALAPWRANRYQTMDDLAVDLKRLERELESGSSPSYEDLERTLGSKYRNRRIIISIAVLLVLALVTIGVWQGPSWLTTKLDGSSILILPMTLRGQGQGAAYAGHAFSEQLAINLSAVENLAILPVPQTGSEDTVSTLESAALARDVGAGYVLIGVLSREQDLVAANLNLIDATQNHIELGIRKQRPDGNLSRLASEVTRDLLAGLGISVPMLYDAPLSMVERSEIAGSPDVVIALNAYEHNDYATAMEHAEKALQQHPDDLATYILISYIALQQVQSRPSENYIRKATECFGALNNFDPDNPYTTAFLHLGENMFNDSHDPHASITRLSAILDRSDITARMQAYVLRQRGYLKANIGEEAGSLSDLRAAIKLSPASAVAHSQLSRTLSRLGQYQLSIEHAYQSIALQPDDSYMYQFLGLALSRQGNWEESLTPYTRACQIDASQEPCGLLAIALHNTRHKADAIAIAQEAESMTSSIFGSYNLACYYALAGDPDAAIRRLRKAVELGYSSVWIEKDNDLASLRSNPEFEAIVDEVKERIKQD